jgi:hypothetical protein
MNGSAAPWRPGSIGATISISSETSSKGAASCGHDNHLNWFRNPCATNRVSIMKAPLALAIGV